MLHQRNMINSGLSIRAKSVTVTVNLIPGPLNYVVFISVAKYLVTN